LGVEGGGFFWRKAEGLRSLGFAFGFFPGFDGVADSLNLDELLHILRHVAVDAPLVNGEELEAPGVGHESAGVGEGLVDFGALGFARRVIERTGEGEDVVLDGAGAPTTGASRCQHIAGIRLRKRRLRSGVPDRFLACDPAPMILGDGLGELALDAFGGRDAGYDPGAEFVVGFLLFGSPNVKLTGKSMTIRVHAGNFPAFPAGAS